MTVIRGKKAVWVLWGLSAVSAGPAALSRAFRGHPPLPHTLHHFSDPQVVASTTVILLLITFSDVLSVQSRSDATGIPDSQLASTLAGCILSAILIILLQSISFFVLLRATNGAAGRCRAGGSSLPFTAASFFHVALFLLLTGMILDSNTRNLEGKMGPGGWSSADSAALTASYVLCFTTCGVYVIVSVALLLLMRSLRAAAVPTDLEAALAAVSLRSAGAPASSDDVYGRRAAPARSDTATPSDYADSVAAARKNLGAWGRG